MDDWSWSADWKDDLYAWLEESRGDWKGLSEALGSEAPAKVGYYVGFGVQEVGANLFAALEGSMRVSHEDTAAPPDTLRATFVREEGYPARSEQIVVMSGETFMHMLGTTMDAVGAEPVD